jgi:hypothetical protein
MQSRFHIVVNWAVKLSTINFMQTILDVDLDITAKSCMHGINFQYLDLTLEIWLHVSI